MVCFSALDTVGWCKMPLPLIPTGSQSAEETEEEMDTVFPLTENGSQIQPGL